MDLPDGTRANSKATKTKHAQVSSLYCILCTAIMGSKKAYKSMYRCMTCGVSLCIVPHRNCRKIYFDRWHIVNCLKTILKDNREIPIRKGKWTSPRKAGGESASNRLTRRTCVALPVRRGTPTSRRETGGRSLPVRRTRRTSLAYV
jgi:hypothetical protein